MKVNKGKQNWTLSELQHHPKNKNKNEEIKT
jgi:hypothetical protein